MIFFYTIYTVCFLVDIQSIDKSLDRDVTPFVKSKLDIEPLSFKNGNMKLSDKQSICSPIPCDSVISASCAILSIIPCDKVGADAITKRVL